MTTGRIVVRQAEEDDLDEVVRIERLSFADPWTKDAFVSSLALERMRFLVAEDDEGRAGRPAAARPLLGYVICLLLGDEGEIADLAVDPAARRRGVGGVLLDTVSRQAMERGVQALYLEVRESNAGARFLYTSRGFLEVGRRRGYYRSPREDALLMRCDLGRT